MEECNCEGWKVGWEQMISAQVFCANHIAGPKYMGPAVEFCPWCGKHLTSDVKEEQRKCQWISVEEKLPRVGEYVIGAAPIDNESWRIHGGRFRSPEDHGGLSVIEVGNEGWHWISHWMLLPEPPSNG